MARNQLQPIITLLDLLQEKGALNTKNIFYPIIKEQIALCLESNPKILAILNDLEKLEK